MRTQDIEYTADGTQMIGYLAVDDAQPGRRPAVLVCHGGPGLDEHARASAERLAALGYTAFALDYHGGGKRLPGDQWMGRIGSLMADPLKIRSLAEAGLDVLLADDKADPDRVAAIGYCFGGTMALELARAGTRLRAVVGFHSGLATARPEDAKQIKASVLVCIGADDPIIPPEQRAAFENEMRNGDVDWQMVLYGGAMHSFTDRNAADLGLPGIVYHAPSAARSWRAMLAFFEEKLLPV
jgi:dienelactone hydrolase